MQFHSYTGGRPTSDNYRTRTVCVHGTYNTTGVMSHATCHYCCCYFYPVVFLLRAERTCNVHNVHTRVAGSWCNAVTTYTDTRVNELNEKPNGDRGRWYSFLINPVFFFLFFETFCQKTILCVRQARRNAASVFIVDHVLYSIHSTAYYHVTPKSQWYYLSL